MSAAAPLRRSTRERRTPAHLLSPSPAAALLTSAQFASSPSSSALFGGSSDGGDQAAPVHSGKVSKAGQRRQQRMAASHPYAAASAAAAVAVSASVVSVCDGAGFDLFDGVVNEWCDEWSAEWTAEFNAKLTSHKQSISATLPTDLTEECAFSYSEPLSPVSTSSMDESISTAMSSHVMSSRSESDSSSSAFVDERPRCPYPSHPSSVHHHDHVLGRSLYHHPSVDTTPTEALNRVYAMLCLAVLCTGLDLPSVLKKWEHIQEAFDGFDVVKVAAYGAQDIERLQRHPKVMKDKVKINAIIQNATAIQRMETAKPGSFLALLWSQHTSDAADPNHFPEVERVLPHASPSATVPPNTDSAVDFAAARTAVVVADGLSASRAVLRLKLLLSGAKLKRMGDAACLQFAQSVGLVNHHAHSCYCWRHCEDEYQQVIALRQGKAAMVAA